MDERVPTRRRFLYLVGAGGLAGLAACEGHRPTGSTSRTADTDTDSTAEGTATDGETEPRVPGGGGTPRPGNALAETHPGLRIESEDPPVGEADSRDPYAGYVTPIDSHYVVNHYETPAIDAGEWVITIVSGGDGVEIGMDELRGAFPTMSVTHTMQCSGNGRAYFDPEISGYQLSDGAAGTAVWTGSPVGAVLREYSMVDAGTWLTAAGGDAPEGEPVFARSIPMKKALNDCLLAYRMNDEPLPRDHGYPVRLVVPGWFGNNSVKWLAELRVVDRMLAGERRRRYHRWQQEKYRMLPEDSKPDDHSHINEFDTWTQIRHAAAGDVDYLPYMYDQVVKSLIGYPADGATLHPRDLDGQVELLGVAWAGDDPVTTVEISTDGGETWADAEFFGPDQGPAAWRRFRYLWEPEPGKHLLVSRATDGRDRAQPRDVADPKMGLAAIKDGAYPWNQRGYGNDAYRPYGVRVTVVE